MQIEVSRESLLRSLSDVWPVVPSKSPKAILLQVKLVVANDKTELVATDLEDGIRRSVENVSVVKTGEAMLPAARMREILRESTDDIIKIEVAESRVVVRGQRSRYNLSSDDPKEFPDVPVFDATDFYSLPGRAIAELARHTEFAADASASRYATNGVLVECNGNSMTFVSTDGRRLAIAKAVAKKTGTAPNPDKHPIVPTKTLVILQQISSGDTDVLVAIDDRKAIFKTPTATLSSRLVEGRFPRWQEVLPTRKEHEIDIAVCDFLSALRQASITSSEESRGVDISFGNGKIVFSNSSAEVGKSEIELPVAFDGKLDITFDPQYLIEMLKRLPPEDMVHLELIDGSSVALLRHGDNYTYCIMPLTR